MPRVSDNDDGEITVSLDGKELRGWSYATDDERRSKMLLAREYVEGWEDAMQKVESAKAIATIDRHIEENERDLSRRGSREQHKAIRENIVRLEDIRDGLIQRSP